MSQGDGGSSVFPVFSGSSASITLTVFRRPTKGAGAFSALTSIPTLAILWNNSSEQSTLDSIRQAIVDHVMNYITVDDYAPAVGTPNQSIAQAILDWRPINRDGARAVSMFIDGQFGTVAFG